LSTAKRKLSIPVQSVSHRLLAVASATPCHWFELEERAVQRGLHLCDKSAIVTALKLLANQGFLQRHQGQQDGNAQMYTLTSQGEDALDGLHSAALNTEAGSTELNSD